METTDKPLFFVGSALDDLRKFPEEVKRVVGFALREAQGGRKYVSAKPMQGFGSAAVLEIVEDHDGDAWRAVYTVRFADAVYVLHAFQKKSTRGITTPKREMERIHERLKRASEHYREWVKQEERTDE